MLKPNVIGRITSISNKVIIAEIFSELGNYINTPFGIRFIGEVGTYVTIHDASRTIIAEIEGISDTQSVATKSEFNKPTGYRVLYLSLLGEIIDCQFTFGVAKMPLLFSEIQIITTNELDIVLSTSEDNEILVENSMTRLIYLPIGQSPLFPDYTVKIHIDKFFGAHFAILGNTGSGKSNTFARVVQTVFAKEDYSAYGAKFIIFDANGEYNPAFNSLNENNQEIIKLYLAPVTSQTGEKTNLEIPIWALSADDWGILLRASEKTQLPLLRRAILFARLLSLEDEAKEVVIDHIIANVLLSLLRGSESSPSKSDKLLGVLSFNYSKNITLDTKIPASISGRSTTLTIRQGALIDYGKLVNIGYLMKALENYINQDAFDVLMNKVKKTITPFSFEDFDRALNLAVLYEGSVSSQRIQEYTAPLLTRVQAIMESDAGHIFQKTEFAKTDEYIDFLINGKQVVVIDISSLDDSVSDVVTNVFSKILFDYLRKQTEKAEIPVNLILEEAHRYIRHNTNALDFNIFERIAKEGRKFGLLLGISSQRPSELSKTVLSQCNNFIIHRIQNPDDLQYISRMVPYINENMISRLTFLQTGNALIFGSALRIPTLIKFELANPQTDSTNARISEKWYVKNPNAIKNSGQEQMVGPISD